MVPHKPVWIEHGDPVLRRGLAACLIASSYPVLGESEGWRPTPAPNLGPGALLVFEVDTGNLAAAVALARDTGVRLVGLMGERADVTLGDLRRAGLAAALGARSLTPPLLLECLRTVSADEPEGPRPMLNPTSVHEDRRLTDRELDVLRFLAEGATTRDIAERLNYSERTVKNVVHDVLVKLRGRTRAHAVAVAARSGVI